MSENTKSVAIAAIITVTVAASIHLFMKQGMSRLRADRAPDLVMKASRPALVHGPDIPSTAKNPRLAWSEQWQRRMTAKGWTLKVRTFGNQDDSLELSWGRDRTTQDNEHRETLQTQRDFFDMLRKMKFVKLVMRVEGRKVWSQKL